MYHLILTNILIIALDIVLLGIQYAGLFYLGGSMKPAVYGIKLKIEFSILNRLKAIAKSRQSPFSRFGYNGSARTESREVDGNSGKARMEGSVQSKEKGGSWVRDEEQCEDIAEVVGESTCSRCGPSNARQRK
jgi:hypothetical protein